MTFDLDYRYRRALQPDGLRTIATANLAVADAIADCKRAGLPSEADPAVILLARHLGRIASGIDPELTHEQDLALRAQCMNRIAELKSKPMLVALVRSRTHFDPHEKAAFHAEARRHCGRSPMRRGSHQALTTCGAILPAPLFPVKPLSTATSSMS